jgi:hypothetical protein
MPTKVGIQLNYFIIPIILTWITAFPFFLVPDACPGLYTGFDGTTPGFRVKPGMTRLTLPTLNEVRSRHP